MGTWFGRQRKRGQPGNAGQFAPDTRGKTNTPTPGAVPDADTPAAPLAGPCQREEAFTQPRAGEVGHARAMIAQAPAHLTAGVHGNTGVQRRARWCMGNGIAHHVGEGQGQSRLVA